MPHVKWRKDQDDVLPEGSAVPIGKNVLELAGEAYILLDPKSLKKMKYQLALKEYFI